jgi:hypothetical protein
MPDPHQQFEARLHQHARRVIPPGSFILPIDVAMLLGAGDGEVGESIFARMFAGGRYNPQMARILPPEVVRDVGNGDIGAGRKVLERFVANLRGRPPGYAEGGHVPSPPLSPDVLQGQLNHTFGAGLLGPFAMRQARPQDLPPPKSFTDRIWDNYAKGMSEREFLRSEPLWSGAANLSEKTGVPQHEAFSKIANEMSVRRGSGQYVSPDDALRIMGAQQLNSTLKRDDDFAGGGAAKYQYGRPPLRRYAKGGAVGKMTKQAANYRDSAEDNRFCARCTMHRPRNNSCTLVAGPVHRVGLCDHYQREG